MARVRSPKTFSGRKMVESSSSSRVSSERMPGFQGPSARSSLYPWFLSMAGPIRLVECFALDPHVAPVTSTLLCRVWRMTSWSWALTPPQVVGSLLQAPLFLLASLQVAPLLVAVPLREGRLRSLIPFLATLLLDRPVKAGAGLAITLPTGSPEVAHNRF